MSRHTCTFTGSGKECGKPAASFYRIRSGEPINKGIEARRNRGYLARCKEHTLNKMGLQTMNWEVTDEDMYTVASIMGS